MDQLFYGLHRWAYPSLRTNPIRKRKEGGCSHPRFIKDLPELVENYIEKKGKEHELVLERGTIHGQLTSTKPKYKKKDNEKCEFKRTSSGRTIDIAMKLFLFKKKTPPRRQEDEYARQKSMYQHGQIKRKGKKRTKYCILDVIYKQRINDTTY